MNDGAGITFRESKTIPKPPPPTPPPPVEWESIVIPVMMVLIKRRKEGAMIPAAEEEDEEEGTILLPEAICRQRTFQGPPKYNSRYSRVFARYRMVVNFSSSNSRQQAFGGGASLTFWILSYRVR